MDTETASHQSLTQKFFSNLCRKAHTCQVSKRAFHGTSGGNQQKSRSARGYNTKSLHVVPEHVPE